MLKKISCNQNNYLSILKPYVSKDNIENKKKVKLVEQIINDVRKNGDKALKKYTKKFDGFCLDKVNNFLVTSEEFKTALKDCSKEYINSIHLAANRIKKYQTKILPKSIYFKDNIGIKMGCIWTAISSCGLYVPGGKAIYPSSVLMNAIPAKIAGVKRVVITTPANNNKISPEILVAAHVAGVNEVYKIGGVQAVAALAFGTESIKKVDKIAGPGNSFVAEAKKQVYGHVGIDSIAGPSEILIIADKHSNAKWIAIDLLSQAEHDEEARAILVTDDNKLIKNVDFYIKYFLKKISRKNIAIKSIKNNGLAILINDIKYSHLIANYIAPEHLQIMSKNKKSLLKKITNAGAMFVGNYSPEALGDYVAGPSHVLPTSGNARFESGLSVLDFWLGNFGWANLAGHIWLDQCL